MLKWQSIRKMKKNTRVPAGWKGVERYEVLRLTEAGDWRDDDGKVHPKPSYWTPLPPARS